MKKFRHIIILLLALIMVIAVPLVACDSCSSCKGGKEEETKTLQSISLNTDNVKKDYVFDQELNTDGLVVKATYVKDKNNEVVEETLNEGDYEVKGYKKNAVGTQTVKVIYTYRNVTKDATYDVTVTLYQDGLEITLVEGVLPSDADKIDTYTLTAEKKTVEIDTSKVVVKKVNKDGSVGAAITDYSTSLYKGQEKIELTNGKASVGRGAYAIIVEKNSDIYDNYPLVAFAIIYVNDDMVSFVLKSGVGQFEQTMGEDVISNTWVFEATYASGAKADITADKCDYEIDSMAVGSNSAVISYTDYNPTGSKVTLTANVSYNILRKYGKTVYTYDFNAIKAADNSDITVDKAVLTQVNFKGVNSFLKVGSGKVTYRTGSKVIEIENEGFTVTFGGTGKITIGISSTGGSNDSRFGLKGPDGSYIAAENVPATITKVDGNLYDVRGTSANELTFNITTAGTYTIVCDKSAYGRGGRIHAVVMEDNVPEPAAAMLSLANQTYISYNKDEVV